MANRPESMGIYADLAKKRAGLYDVAVEGRVRAWIEGVLGRPLTGPSFRESLMDGTIVCELVNKLKPGTISKIHRSSVLMFRRENFGFFQNACVKIGCKQTETCVFEDVYDDKNMGQFLVNIIALARNTQYEPGYKGPILQDAAKLSGQGAAAPTEPKYLGSSFADQAALAAHDTKIQAHFVDHGIIAPIDPAAPPERAAGTYLGLTAAEQAAAQGEAARNAGRYVEHGIVMNPDENPANKPK